MNRKTKLFINILIILTFFVSIYFTEGYFLSKEEAINDALRCFYIEEKDVIDTLTFDKDIIVLASDKNDKNLLMINFNLIGPFYKHTTKTFSQIYPELDLNITYNFSQDNTIIFYAYRVNKDINHLEISFSNGDTIICNEWHHDYIYTTYKKPDVGILYCEIKAYDANNNYIGSFGGGSF